MPDPPKDESGLRLNVRTNQPGTFGTPERSEDSVEIYITSNEKLERELGLRV
jgi:hypothetical protein